MLNDGRSPLPGTHDTLLLRAALLKGDVALSAYWEWRKSLDIDALDFGLQRVLPLLVKNLRAHGVEDTLMDRFRGVGRFAWYLNQTLTTAVRPILEGLNQSRIRFVLLKGAAFVASVPDQLSLRAMTDIDLLVRRDDAPSAMEVIENSGWRPYYGRARFVRQELIDRAVSCDFQFGQHGHLDLHWYLRDQNRWPGADAALWERLIKVELAGQPCHAPSYEDQVLHALMHGAPWNGAGSIRWVTDSVIILRLAHDSFDWPYLMEQCRTRHVVIQVRNCLQYLRQHLDVEVPDHVTTELRRERTSVAETLDYRFRARNPATLTRPAKMLLAFQTFRGLDENIARASTTTALRQWIKHIWGAHSVVEASCLALLAVLGHPPLLRALVWSIWRRDGRTSALGRREPPRLGGAPIDLTLTGDPKGALLYGWADPEADGRWTDGPEAAIILEAEDQQRDLTIAFSVCSMLAPDAPKMRVEIWANGTRLDDWNFDLSLSHWEMHARSLTIPKSALRGRCLVLTFVIRHPTSPQSLGLSLDTRKLGLFVREFGPASVLRPEIPANRDYLAR